MAEAARTVTRDGRRISVTFPMVAQADVVEFRVYSSRNDKIDTLTDTSPHAPRRKADPNTETILENQQMWLPIVDIVLGEGAAGRARFSGKGTATFAPNGMFNKDMIPVADDVLIPASKLAYWENAIFVDGPDRALAEFCIVVPAAVTDGGFRADITALSDDWSGWIDCVVAGSVAGSVTVPPPSLAKSTGLRGAGLARERVADSLNASVRYLMRSQVPPSVSIVSEGLYLFYDHDARTFRTPHWNWAWGPAIKLLLEAAASGTGEADRAQLLGVAKEVGAASLRFQMGDPDHKAYGYNLGRWSPGLRNTRKIGYVSPSSENFPVAGWSPSYAAEKFEAGFEGYYSPADSLFLAGWGWVPLGEATGDDRFTKAAALCADAGRRQLETFEIVPQDLPVLADDWTNYTREEAGFGMEAYAELYRATGDRRYLETGRRYIDGLLEKLEMPDGLWNRHWWRNTGERTPCEYKSRSLGWAEMGLQAAHRMSPDKGKYLERAVKLAEHFLKAQDESGAWGLVIDRPIGKTERSAKGTALWSMLLYRLYKLSGDKRHLHAARRAMGWLLDNQYFGADPDGVGGVISCSAFSGVNYRRWYKLSCAYTTSFFGLAALEELRLA